MNEVHVGPREQFVPRVAEDTLPGRIHALEVAVEAGHTQHVERQREESIQLLFGALALHELADLRADARQHA